MATIYVVHSSFHVKVAGVGSSLMRKYVQNCKSRDHAIHSVLNLVIRPANAEESAQFPAQNRNTGRNLLGEIFGWFLLIVGWKKINNLLTQMCNNY
jgi:hypothetical protein